MTPEIEQWISPLLSALFALKTGDDAFVRFMERAIDSASAATSRNPGIDDLASATSHPQTIDRVPVGRIGKIDWIRLGQLIRSELGWDNYPATPPKMSRSKYWANRLIFD